MDDRLDVRGDKVGDDEEWDGSDKRKHRSSRSRKSGSVEDAESLDVGGNRRSSSGNRSESRKRSAGASGRGGSDEDDHEARKESRSKQMKKKQEESSLEKLSSWYQDGEFESRQGGDKYAGKGHGRIDESEKRKLSSKISEHESFHGGSKTKEETSFDGEYEKTLDRDSAYSERRESSREKGQGSVDVGRSSRRRWDVSEEYHHEKASDRALDSSSDKGIKANYRDERRSDLERAKGKSRSEVADADIRYSPTKDRSGREKGDKYRQHRTPSGRDGAENREMSSNVGEDGWTRDKSTREVPRSNRSRTPEKSGKHPQESQHPDEYDRSSDMRRKDVEKEGYRDDRSKGRDESWGDRNRERESSKENWRRRDFGNEKESKDGDTVYDRGRDWGPRHGRDRNDNERTHGRSRSEAVKTSSTFGISKDNYDVIEIERKPLDYAQARDSDAKSVIPQADESMRDERVRKQDFSSGSSRDESKDKYMDEDPSFRDQNSWKDDADYQVGKGRYQKSGRGGGGSQIPVSSHETGSFGRAPAQGMKGSRMGRGGRGRPAGRDNQQLGPPLPMMGSPFGHLSMAPPGPMQPLQPGISPSPGPPISPGVFMSSFSPPIVWPGARGMEMNMLGVPPAMSSVPPGTSAPRFPPNKGAPPISGMFFNQGSGRGVSPNISGPGFSHAGPLGRGTPPDKSPGGWAPSRSGGPPGKAPSRGEQNDYSQNFVDTGMRPQNFIRELELTNVVEDYPKLRELIQKKDEIVAKSASAPMYLKCDLKDFELSPEFFGTKFDVILIDPPWEEYVHRAPGAADHMEYWSFEEILNLKIEAIADTPSFIFLWVGDGVGLEQGRQCLKKWGFRRCEDICWVKTNKTNATPGLRHDSHTLFQHSKEHCLMGIKGTVRRSTDGHIIHANIDTDVIIAEEPSYGSTQKPEDMYRIVEHFALGRRRLELFGEDHNIRAGWLTVGKGLSSSNFNAEAYVRNFGDKDGKVWQGGSGRNPPPEAPHLVLTTPEIEALRPKSPMKNQQQQSASISLTTGNSSSRRPAGNSPQNPNAFAINQEASGANLSNAGPWGVSPFEVFRGNIPPENKVFDMYGIGGQASDY